MNNDPIGILAHYACPQDLSLSWDLLEANPDGIELSDLDGSLVYLNPAAAQSHAKPRSELIGQNLWNLISPGQSQSHQKTLVNKVINSGQPIQFSVRLGDQWNLVRICPIRGEADSTQYVATFTRDITPQIQAEERLKLAALQVLTIQEEERRRIAQDLHDDLGQRMTALILNLKSIHGSIQDESTTTRAEIAEQVKQTIRTVEDMMRDIRQVFYELRPPAFSAMPLAKVLDSFCSSLAVSTGLRIVFSSQEKLPVIPVAQSTAVYRLVQEGINNVVKHARAASVWINLEFVNSEVNISLEDDGQGFDLTQRTRFGMGLQGIRERFFMLSGSFDIESAPGQGTRLYGSLPLAQPVAD